MKSALAVLLAGLVMLAYAMTLPVYKDENAFQLRYSEMRSGDSAAFHALRDEQLTPKYRLQDYGVCALLLSGVLAVRHRIWRMMTPRTALPIVAAALLAPALTVAASVFDLIQGMERGEFPHWADSLGIPLMGMPVLLVAALVWSLAHLAFLSGKRRSGVPLRNAFARGANIWLLVVAAITLILTAGLLVEGAYWFAPAGVLWLYLYVTLAAARLPANESKS